MLGLVKFLSGVKLSMILSETSPAMLAVLSNEHKGPDVKLSARGSNTTEQQRQTTTNGEPWWWFNLFVVVVVVVVVCYIARRGQYLPVLQSCTIVSLNSWLP